MRGDAVKTCLNTESRFFKALFLTAIYLVIVLSPLAPVMLESAHLAHAMTRECSGDCNVCGCTPEQRANHTCCCQQKLKQKAHQAAALADCCKKESGGIVTVVRCGCPCGPEKTVALLKLSGSDALPFVFHACPKFRLPPVKHYDPARRMVTRPGDPPDPPPRLSIFS